MKRTLSPRVAFLSWYSSQQQKPNENASEERDNVAKEKETMLPKRKIMLPKSHRWRSTAPTVQGREIHPWLPELSSWVNNRSFLQKGGGKVGTVGWFSSLFISGLHGDAELSKTLREAVSSHCSPPPPSSYVFIHTVVAAVAIIIIYMCVQVWAVWERAHACVGARGQPLRVISFGNPLLLPCGLQGSNSGFQAWQQAPLPAEPHLGASPSFD